MQVAITIDTAETHTYIPAYLVYALYLFTDPILGHQTEKSAKLVFEGRQVNNILDMCGPISARLGSCMYKMLVVSFVYIPHCYCVRIFNLTYFTLQSSIL